MKKIPSFSRALIAVFVLTAFLTQLGQAAPLQPAPRLQTTATPDGWRWILANENTADNWVSYATADYIRTVLPDGDDIWATSNAGLLRWNRKDHALTQYTSPQVPLPGNSLSGLLLHAGKLYVSGRDGVAIFDRNSHWTTYRTEQIGFKKKTGMDEILQGTRFEALALINDDLWVGTNHGLARMSADGHWEVLSPNPSDLLLEYVKRIEQRADGVYVFSSNGMPSEKRTTAVARYVDGQWHRVDIPMPDYLVAPDSSWWKSEVNQVTRSRDQGKTWQTVYKGGIWPEAQYFDPSGKVYLDSNDAVIVVENDKVVETFRYSDVGPQVRFVNQIEHDDRGRLWFGTDGLGLTMYDGQRWRNWQPENSAIREDAIRGMDVSQGKVYLGLFGCGGCGGVGIYDIDNDQWTHLWPEESELSGGGVGGVTLSPQGELYLPTAAGQLDIYDDGKWQHIKMPAGPDHIMADSNDGVFDQSDSFWVATDGGLWKYSGTEWQALLQDVGVSDLAFDQSGRLWAATSRGLAVLDLDDQWYFYNGAGGYPTELDRVEKVKIDAAGRVWAVSLYGVLIFNGQEWQVIPSAVVDETYWEGDVAFDAQGHAWIGTSDGAALFTGKPDIGPFAGLNERPAATKRSTDAPSFWSLLFSQGACMMVGVPGAWAFARLRRMIRHKRVSVKQQIERS
jgi:ligand-binding sensor domain-containing protein